MSKPVEATLPDGVRMTWKDEEVIIEATRLYEKGKEIHGRLTIQTTKAGWGRHLRRANFNFDSLTTRKSWVKELAEVYSAPWGVILEQLCFYVTEHFNQDDLIIDLDSQEPETALDYLAYPIVIADGPTCIYGDGNSFKSYLTLCLATCIHLGIADNPLELETKADPTPVLYLDWEMERKKQNERLTMLRKGMSLEPFKLPWLRCVSPLADNVSRLLDAIEERGTKFLIVDSLFGACGGELKETSEPDRFFKAIRALKLPTLTLAHHNKADKDGKNTGIYGSVFFRNFFRSIWECTSQQDPGTKVIDTVLAHRKWNYTENFRDRGFRGTFRSGEVRIESRQLTPASFAGREPTVADQIIALLLQRGKMKTGEIAEALGKGIKHVSSVLADLHGKSKIVRLDENYWGAIVENKLLHF